MMTTKQLIEITHVWNKIFFNMYIYFISINKVYKKSFQKKMTGSSWLNFRKQNLIPPISLLCSKDLQFFYKETSETFTPFFVRSFLYRFLLIRYFFFWQTFRRLKSLNKVTKKIVDVPSNLKKKLNWMIMENSTIRMFLWSTF